MSENPTAAKKVAYFEALGTSAALESAVRKVSCDDCEDGRLLSVLEGEPTVGGWLEDLVEGLNEWALSERSSRVLDNPSGGFYRHDHIRRRHDHRKLHPAA
jgi:hypothetical protein